MMRSRKTWFTSLALALPLVTFVGCGESPEPPPAATGADALAPGTSSPPGMSPSPTSSADPSTAPGYPKPEMKSDAPKADAPKSDESKSEAPKVDTPKSDAPKVDAPKIDAPKADAPKTAAAKLTNEEVAELKKLPADDQVLALKQAVCPVSNENLGGMGAPIKVSAEGKSFFICCKSCKEEVDKNGKTVVAKLAK